MSVDQVLKAKASTDAFVRLYFKDPEDPDVTFEDLSRGASWQPYEPQTLLYNLIDFGYDISTAHFKPSIPAEVIVMVWPRQYGKTTACASAAAALAIRYPGSRIGIVSAGDDAAKEFMDRVVWFITNSPFADLIDKEKADTLRLRNKSVIRSFPTSEKAIRGKSLRWLFLDETAKIEDFIIDEVSMPTVSSAGAFKKWKTPSVIMLSTPGLMKGRFYDYFKRGLSKREVGCISCGNKTAVMDATYSGITFPSRDMPPLPKCAKCGGEQFEYIPNEVITITLDPWNHPTRTREEIQARLDLLGNTPGARRELLGEFVGDDAGVFQKEWLESCVDPRKENIMKPERDVRYAMSVDFGKTTDATVITVGHLADNIIEMDYMFHLPAQGGMEYNEIRYHVLRIIDVYCPFLLILDSTGLGEPIAEQIERDIHDLQTIGVECRFRENGGDIVKHFEPNRRVFTKLFQNKKNHLGFLFDYKSKLDLIDNLSNLFQRRLIRIMHQYQSKTITILWKELLSFAFEVSTNNRIIYGVQREHDDTVISLALLAWALKETPWVYTPGKFGGEETLVL